MKTHSVLNSEIIMVNGEKKAISLGDMITLICHKDEGIKIEYPKRISIDVEMTLHHGRKVVKLHKHTKEMMCLLFDNLTEDSPIFNCSERHKETLGYVHGLGLIDLTLKFIDSGVDFVWSYPETLLHPSTQAKLADVMIAISRLYL